MRHDHPRLARPITPEKFYAEFGAEAPSGLRREHGRRMVKPLSYRVSIIHKLSQIHCSNSRRYAECNPVARVFYFAPETLWLPRENRLGLIAHEWGHALAYLLFGAGHSERDADTAAAQVLGVEITYSKLWPGKGLQVGRRVR